MTEQTFAAIRSFLANRVTDRGYAVRFADARCRCGAAHFALTVNEDFGAAWMRCRACDTKYALHDPDTRGATAGSAEDSADECVCTCDADEFEVVCTGTAIRRALRTSGAGASRAGASGATRVGPASIRPSPSSSTR
jgi:hypothetical protein